MAVVERSLTHPSLRCRDGERRVFTHQGVGGWSGDGDGEGVGMGIWGEGGEEGPIRQNDANGCPPLLPTGAAVVPCLLVVVDEVGVRHVQHLLGVEAAALLRHQRLVADHVLHVVRTERPAEPQVRHLPSFESTHGTRTTTWSVWSKRVAGDRLVQACGGQRSTLNMIRLGVGAPKRVT